MFEKVNKYHPDKVADRIAGATVDLAYKGTEGGFKSGNPRIAVEVLLGHGSCNVIVETNLGRSELREKDIVEAVYRIAGERINVSTILVGQDQYLSENQRHGLRCGDNGIFRGRVVSYEQALLAAFSNRMSERFGSDGKYIINGDELIICQSNADMADILDILRAFEREKSVKFRHTTINPIGYWTGGTDVDSGATNRKLGSDMGDSVTGGGLHGKDLSKADVSVNIFCHLLAEQYKCDVEACCAIGDDGVTFILGDGTEKNVAYPDIVEQARNYLSQHYDGSFEKFAEIGLI